MPRSSRFSRALPRIVRHRRAASARATGSGKSADSRVFVPASRPRVAPRPRAARSSVPDLLVPVVQQAVSSAQVHQLGGPCAGGRLHQGPARGGQSCDRPPGPARWPAAGVRRPGAGAAAGGTVRGRGRRRGRRRGCRGRRRRCCGRRRRRPGRRTAAGTGRLGRSSACRGYGRSTLRTSRRTAPEHPRAGARQERCPRRRRARNGARALRRAGSIPAPAPRQDGTRARRRARNGARAGAAAEGRLDAAALRWRHHLVAARPEEPDRDHRSASRPPR